MNARKKDIIILIASAFLLMAVLLLSISLGSIILSPKELLFGLLHKSGYKKQSIIIWSLRLPRILGAVISGCALSTAGLILQQSTGNDLCAPNIIGVNSGAGLFVIGLLCFAPSLYQLLPISAFFGALLATLAVLTVSQLASGSKMRTTLVLSGVAVSAFFNAGISFLSYMFPDVLVSYTAFTSGSLSGIYMQDIALPAVITSACLGLSLLIEPKLRLLCLGDTMAHSLGVNVRILRIGALIIASALCASSVSFAGLIGFVGLIVPHIAKKLTSVSSSLLMPVSMILGGCVLLASDLLGRTLFAPSELPCGIIMAAAGAPFFIFLLLKGRNKV